MDKAEAKRIAAALTSSTTGADVPAGWFTTREISVAIDRSLPRVYCYLREGRESGHIQKKSFRIMTGRGLLPVPHYKLTPPK